MRDVVLIVFLITVVPLTFYRPIIGLSLWSWSALFIPTYYVYGIAASLPYGKLFAGLTVVSWVFSKKSKISIDSSRLFLIFILLLWITLTSVLSINQIVDPWVQYDRMIKVFVAMLFVGLLVKTKEEIHLLIFFLVAALAFHGVLEGLKYIASGGGHRITGPVKSIIWDNNHFALAMCAIVPFLLYYWGNKNSNAIKIVLLGVTGLVLISVIGTYSRGGFVGLLFIGGWLFIKSKRKVLASVTVLVIALGFSFLVTENWSSRMETLNTVEEDSSFMGRVVAWKQSTLIAMDRPVVGGGFFSVQDFEVWQKYAKNFDKLSIIETPEPNPYRAHAAHSIYFQVLGDHGFVGFVLFALFFVIVLVDAYKIAKYSKQFDELDWLFRLSSMMIFSFLIFFTVGAGLSMAYFELMYILAAIVFSMKKLVQTHKAEQEKITAT